MMKRLETKTKKRPLPPFAIALRSWRAGRSLTRKDAGARLGVSWRTVEMWERGRSPHPFMCRAVCKKINALNVDTATLAA